MRVNEKEKRQQEVHDKGFDMNVQTSYGRMKLGVKTLEDATLNLSAFKAVNKNLANKNYILKALAEQDITALRNISDYFYRTSGIYQRVCNYFANMYRYDWYVVPEVYDESVKSEKIVKDFVRILNYLDNSYIKKLCGDIALNVIRYGAYYAYIVQSASGLVLQ